MKPSAGCAQTNFKLMCCSIWLELEHHGRILSHKLPAGRQVRCDIFMDNRNVTLHRINAARERAEGAITVWHFNMRGRGGIHTPSQVLCVSVDCGDFYWTLEKSLGVGRFSIEALPIGYKNLHTHTKPHLQNGTDCGPLLR